MNEMSENEKRELDAWIAEKVFGYRLVPGMFSNKYTCCICPIGTYHRGKAVRYDEHNICIGSFDAIEDAGMAISNYAPRYTSDPAANRELERNLLEYCSQAGCMLQLILDSKGRFHAIIGEYAAEAETLSLALCLLAKKVYGGEV
jgi:hypothetical protein